MASRGWGRVNGARGWLAGGAAAALVAAVLAAPSADASGPDAAEAPVEVDAAPGPGERVATPAQPTVPSSPDAKPAGESAAPTPTTGVNFLATTIAESGFIPPDTTGAVGATNIVVPLNGRIKVFSKTGTQQYSATLSDFFSSVLPSGSAFDPRVEYDALTGRWFVIAINGGGDNTIMIATSNGSDVSAGETAFTFTSFVHTAVIPGDAGEFADYPTLATDANSVLIGTNNFGAFYDSSSLFVINKANLIAGTLSVSGFQNIGTSTTGMFTPQPAENDNAGATESYVIGVDNAVYSKLDFRRVTYPGGVPTLGPQIQITVPTTTGSADDVPAQGSTTNVDALNDRLYEAMIAIDPATGTPRLWTAHNIEVDATGAGSSTGGRIGSRWYEFGGLPGAGTPTLVQSGTVFDSAATNPDSYWIPSIAANGQGHAVFGSSVAGPSRYVGIALAQRFNGEAAGTLGPVNFAQAGANSYTLLDSKGRNRWGDYSQISIDPTDNMTFWAFQEYVNATNSWAVRVIEVKAPPPAALSSATNAPAGQASTNVTVTGASTNGSGFYEPGPSFPKHIAATVSGGVVVNGVTVNSPTELVLDLDTTGAAPGTKDVTITNPDGQFTTVAGLLTVTGAPISLDYGDAPDPTYPTLLASDGARHGSFGSAMGPFVDLEADGLPSAGADGDDNDGTDDEDGVTFTSSLTAGSNATVDVLMSGGALLNAWVDFNQDGDWADGGEQVFTDTAVVNGVNNLVFAVPAGSTDGATYARFRVDSAGGLAPTGAAADGEVEDYRVTVVCTAPGNDDLADAEVLGATDTEDNSCATAEPGETAGHGGGPAPSHSLWWRWTAPRDGSVVVDTVGSAVADTVLGVYTGTSVTALTVVAQNDDISFPSDLHSRVTFPVTAGTVYKVAVDGFDPSWIGDVTVNLAATLVPTAPSSVSGVAGSSDVAVSWSAPASTGGSPITGYTVTARPGGATCTTPGGLSCTVPGLTNGTPYTFTVTATNAVGTGAASAASAAVTPVRLFVAVTPFRVEDTRPGGVKVGSFDGSAGPLRVKVPVVAVCRRRVLTRCR